MPLTNGLERYHEPLQIHITTPRDMVTASRRAFRLSVSVHICRASGPDLRHLGSLGLGRTFRGWVFEEEGVY